MRPIICIFMLIFAIGIFSCGGHKTTKRNGYSNSKTVALPKKTPKKIKSIMNNAMSFLGTKYKYGGTTKKGMDCSGLLYTSFKKENFILPRTAKSMSSQGKSVSLKKMAIGDLIFFKTNKKKNVINHVGLVIQVKGEIKFIHASVSQGVTISSLNQKYWKNCVASARRVL